MWWETSSEFQERDMGDTPLTEKEKQKLKFLKWRIQRGEIKVGKEGENVPGKDR